MPSDTAPSVPTSLAGERREIQAVFDDQAKFDEALDQLRLAGFDRADLSIPTALPHPGEATPEQGAANPDTPIDRQQARTLAGSTAGVIAAMVGAGVVVGTGGAAAVAAGVAVAAGAAIGGATHAATAGGTGMAREARETAAGERTLVLAVTARDDAQAARATETLRASGAIRVEPVSRSDGTIPAA